MAAKRKGVPTAQLREAVEANLTAILEEIKRERDGLGSIEKRFDMKELHATARTLREVLEIERRERLTRERRAKQRKFINDARRQQLAERIIALGQNTRARRNPPDGGPTDGGAEG